MHLRRIACFLLGGWMLGSVLLLFVTNSNYDAADVVARSHEDEAARALSSLPGEQKRMVLFHMANEASRSYATFSGIIQVIVGLGVAAALFLERRTRFYSAGVALMLLLVLFEWLIIMPQLEWLGRSVDFVPFQASSRVRDQYWNLRGVFLGMEALKLLLGAGITTVLVLLRNRSRGQRWATEEAEPLDRSPQSLRKTRTKPKSNSSGQDTPGT